MTERKILDKYIDLYKSCLTESEKKEVRDMIYKYKDVFGLRDEIDTCPNIKIDIDVMDKTPFFIRPYHIRRQENIIKINEKTVLLSILKGGFSAYLSPVMLISRQVMQDKRLVTDFRCLNTRIARQQLSLSINKGYICNTG